MRLFYKITVFFFIVPIVTGVNSVNAYCQVNLVPNHSFEIYDTCPNSTAQLSYATGWQFAGASTDYYNACAPQGSMSEPLNIYGYQTALDGNAYIGMIVFALHEELDTSNYYYREPAGAFLTMPMTVGLKYFVSFWAALTLDSNNFESCCATNKLGVLFSTIPYSTSNPTPINNFAQVYSDSMVTDSVNWTRVSGSFIADSAYSFISIGNFFDSTNTQVLDYYNNYPITSAAYYYIDDVKVSTDSLYVMSAETIKPANIFNLYPNPNNGYFYISAEYPNFLQIDVFDLLGRTVYQSYANLPCSIDLSFLNSNIYMLTIKKDEHNYYSTKLLINK